MAKFLLSLVVDSLPSVVFGSRRFLSLRKVVIATLDETDTFEQNVYSKTSTLSRPYGNWGSVWIYVRRGSTFFAFENFYERKRYIMKKRWSFFNFFRLQVFPLLTVIFQTGGMSRDSFSNTKLCAYSYTINKIFLKLEPPLQKNNTKGRFNSYCIMYTYIFFSGASEWINNDVQELFHRVFVPLCNDVVVSQ